MNKFNFEEFVYDDMMPFNNVTLSNMDMFNNQQIKNDMQTASLANPEQGFMQGNMFNNIYLGYKNYQPKKLIAKNEKEREFLSLSQLAFAAHEINLYLDNFPDDRSMIRLYNDYRTRLIDVKNKYEQKYGPLTVMSDTLNNFPWLWQSENFPWDEGGM